MTITDDIQAQHQKGLDEMIEILREVINRPGNGIPEATTIRAEPAVVALSMGADGEVRATNNIVLALNGVSTTITMDEIDVLQESEGNLITFLLVRLARIGATNPLNDAQLIRALIAKMGGTVEFTLDEVAAAKKASTLQYDGLKITLLSQ